MSTSAKKVKSPFDPDPTPMNTGESTAEVQGAVRNSRKKVAGYYGRSKTILSGAQQNSQQNSQKKTILGG